MCVCDDVHNPGVISYEAEIADMFWDGPLTAS